MFDQKLNPEEQDAHDLEFYGDRVHMEPFQSLYDDEMFEEDTNNESLFLLAALGHGYNKRPTLNIEVLKHRQLQKSIMDYCTRSDCQPLAVLEAYALNTFGAKQVGRLLEVMIVTLQKAAGVAIKYEPDKGPKINEDYALPHVKKFVEIR